jgi:hypothetical protein
VALQVVQDQVAHQAHQAQVAHQVLVDHPVHPVNPVWMDPTLVDGFITQLLLLQLIQLLLNLLEIILL